MKTRYTYTVVREYDDDDSIDDQLDFFRGVKDEPDEYLYGGTGGQEKISVVLEFLIGDKWISSLEIEDEIKRMKSAEDLPDVEVLGKFSPKIS